MTPSDTLLETSPTVTFSLSLGRSLPNGSELRYADYQAFQSSIRSVLTYHCASLCAETSGRGMYQGKTEDTYTFSGTISGSDLRHAFPDLRDIARLYGQDALVLIIQPNTDTLLRSGV